MDEVKKWDLEQLPGYEAIEKPKEEEEEEEEEDLNKKIKILHARLKKNDDTFFKLLDLEFKARDKGNEDEKNYYDKKQREVKREHKELEKEKERLQKILEEKSGESVKKTKKPLLNIKKMKWINF